MSTSSSSYSILQWLRLNMTSVVAIVTGGQGAELGNHRDMMIVTGIRPLGSNLFCLQTNGSVKFNTDTQD